MASTRPAPGAPIRSKQARNAPRPHPDPVFARKMVVDRDYRRDRVRVVEVHLRAGPVIRIDNREVVEARFVPPQTPVAADGLRPIILEREV